MVLWILSRCYPIVLFAVLYGRRLVVSETLLRLEPQGALVLLLGPKLLPQQVVGAYLNLYAQLVLVLQAEAFR